MFHPDMPGPDETHDTTAHAKDEMSHDAVAEEAIERASALYAATEHELRRNRFEQALERASG